MLVHIKAYSKICHLSVQIECFGNTFKTFDTLSIIIRINMETTRVRITLPNARTLISATNDYTDLYYAVYTRLHLTDKRHTRQRIQDILLQFSNYVKREWLMFYKCAF